MPTTSVISLKGMAAENIDSDQYVDGSIDTAHIGNDQVTGAKLNPALVTGDIIYADGTDTINRLAKPGTPANEVLTFATSASAPSWVAPAAAGIYTLIEMQTSAGTTREFDLATATYDMGFLIQFHNIYPSTAGSLYGYLSSDGGSSWHNAYSWAVNGGDHDGAHIATGGGTDSQIKIIPNQCRVDDYSSACGWVYIPNALDGANRHITWHLAYMENSTADREVIIGSMGNETSVINHNAIKFAYQNGGNVNGRLALYGMKGS